MKALSVRQPWANHIVIGIKEIEYRSWSTDYRGPLLICSSKTPDQGGEGLPLGMALGVADLAYVAKSGAHEYKWYLKNPRKLEHPFPVRGQIKLFDVDYEE